MARWGVGLFFQVTRGTTRGNGLKLLQGMFRLDIRKNFMRTLPRKVVQSPSLVVLRKSVDVALTNTV